MPYSHVERKETESMMLWIATFSGSFAGISQFVVNQASKEKGVCESIKSQTLFKRKRLNLYQTKYTLILNLKFQISN